MSWRKVLVTGGTGFVGAHLVHRLVADGWDTHLIVRSGSSTELIDEIADAVTLHVHDGSTDGMFGIIEECSPQVVFHLASLFLAQHQPKDIEPLIRSNLLFASQLVEAMTATGAYRLINTGTSWQHFENRDYSPVCLYAATKQAFEAILQFYTETTPLRAITLKLFDTYGPDDPRPKLFTLLRKVTKEQQPLDMSPGEQLIDLVYIDDVVEAYLVAAERLRAGLTCTHEHYAVSSGHPIGLKELVRVYEQVTDVKLPIQWGERPYRPREVMVPWDMGAKLPGWEPLVALLEGLTRLNAEMIRHLYLRKYRTEDGG